MKNTIAILMLLSCFACNRKKEAKEAPKAETMTIKDSAKSELKQLSFAVQKDLVCGMPISAGVHDTVTYKGKLYGFCAAECKDEFLKSPGEFLTTK